MIRPFTFITMLLAALSGAYLFAVKHRAQVLDDQLAAVRQATQLDEKNVRVLQAQWASEIDPTRLKQLAAAFSPLQPMKPAQLVTLAALRDALPPPESPAPAENPAAPAPAVIADAAPPPSLAAAITVAPALPLPPPAAPMPAAPPPVAPTAAAPRLLLASASPRPVARVARAAARPQRVGASHLASGEWADSLPPPRPLYSPPPAPVAAIVPASAAPAAGQGGSLLGMAADLAPPQPLVTGN